MKTSTFFLSTLIAAAAMTANAWADHTFSETGTVTVTGDTLHDAVTVDSGVTGTFNITTNNADLKIGALTLNGNLIINEPVCALAEIGNISGSGDITLSKTTANSWGGALVLLGDSAGYTGTINIWNGGNATNNPSSYSQFLVLKSEKAAANATVALGAATVLIVSADSTSIGGLSSADKNTSVVSQATSFAYGNDNGTNPYNISYGGTLPNNDGTHRTLNITGAGTYEFKGTFGSSTNIGSLSLNWSGSGAQTFSGNTYVNDLTVSAGTISLTGANSTIAGDIIVSAGSLSLTGGATTIGGSVENSGTLTLGGVVTLSSGITNTGTVVLNNGIVFDLGGFNFTDGENAIVSGGTVTDGITSANFQNVGVMRGGSFSVNSTTSSLSLTLTQGVAGTLTWGGVSDAVWNTSTDNNSVWVLSESETSSFYFKDNVIFDADATNKTVKLESGNTVTVGTATVSEGGVYTFAGDSAGTATVAGSNLTVESGASLTVGDVGNNTNKHVALDFDNISVAGTLNFNTIGENTWSSLTFEDGGKLHFTDGSPSITNLTVERVTLNGKTTISASADKKLAIGTLSGSGDLVVTGSSAWGALGISIDDLTNYSGSMSISGGNSGAVVSTGVGQIVGKTVAVGDNAKLSLFQSANSNANTHDLSAMSGSGTLELLLFSNANGDGFNLSNFEGIVVVGKASGAGQGRLLLSSSSLNENAQLKVITGGELVFNGSGTNISNNITFDPNSTIHVNDRKNGTLSGDLTATGTVTKKGAGTLTLTGEANIAKITVSSGTLNVGDGGVLTVTGDNNGTSEISGTLNVIGGGTLKFGGHDALGYDNRNASGTVIAQGASSEKLATILFEDTGKLTLSKEIQLKGNTVVKNADGNSNSIKAYGGQFTASGTNNTISTAFDMSGGKVDFSVAQDGSLTVDGEISGSKSWDKLGDGTLTLKGNNSSYSGTITVSAGTLVAGGASALGSGLVTVKGEDNAKLGLIAGITVENVTGGIVLEDGSKLVIDLSNKADATESFTVSLVTGTTITFGTTSRASASSNISDDWYELSGWDKSGWTSSLSYEGNTLSLTMTIPEPSAFGLLAGLGAMALVVSRRRRTKKA